MLLFFVNSRPLLLCGLYRLRTGWGWVGGGGWVGLYRKLWAIEGRRRERQRDQQWKVGERDVDTADDYAEKQGRCCWWWWCVDMKNRRLCARIKSTRSRCSPCMWPDEAVCCSWPINVGEELCEGGRKGVGVVMSIFSTGKHYPKWITHGIKLFSIWTTQKIKWLSNTMERIHFFISEDLWRIIHI